MTNNSRPGGLVRAFEGKTPALAPDVYVADTATILGDVRIGATSSVWCGPSSRPSNSLSHG